MFSLLFRFANRAGRSIDDKKMASDSRSTHTRREQVNLLIHLPSF